MIKGISENRRIWLVGLSLIMMLQLIVASYFCMEKQGYHYDEYYSYYSSNVTYGLAPTDREWKDGGEIRSEFMVLPDEGFNYGMVRLMQTYDVHPPLYYFFLHTVCSFFPGIFSKWFGLGLNLQFFCIAYWLFARISYEIFRQNKGMTALACLLFGFQPGIMSGITFIRMYMLLLVWCLALTCWHIPFWKGNLSLRPGRIIGLILLVTAGFLTHYYFAVFLFFLAAFTCLFHWLMNKRLKESVVYGSCVCAGMVLAVALYPASLSHIFRGYRGTEATGAFFDLSNTLLRLDFFTRLMNDSVFGGAFWLLMLLLVVAAGLLLLKGVKRKEAGEIFKRMKQKEAGKASKEVNPVAYGCLLTVTLGYFFVVAKTALLNAEEANRYELPVYGFWLLLVLGAVYAAAVRLAEGGKWALYKGEKAKERQTKGGNREERAGKSLFVGIATAVILGCQLLALGQGKVQFLYPEDAKNVAWAAEHKTEMIIYLYNPNNMWMIWDELMQYERIYFVSLADTVPIEEKELLEADRIYVYTSRMEAGEELMDRLLEDSTELSGKEKIRELLYCDLYCLD